MSKYIGTYENDAAVQSALTNSELSRPFIAYTTDNDNVIFGGSISKGEIGDIVVYSTVDTLLHYVKQADYNTTTYPTATYVPVGVVAINQADDIYSGATGNVTFMALNWLDKANPDNGNTNKQNIEWGDSSYDIPDLTNYNNATQAVTDMNGKANTAAVLNYATGQTDWQTASAITFTNGQRMYPLFECAWRYHTSGTVQGDWFVPACGQMNELLADDTKLAALNAGMTLVGATSTQKNMILGSSTENSAGVSWYWEGSKWNNYWGIDKTNSYYFGCRAFCEAFLTPLSL